MWDAMTYISQSSEIKKKIKREIKNENKKIKQRKIWKNKNEK